MDSVTMLKIQRYEQTRILKIIADIESITGEMFHQSHVELWNEYTDEIADHTETRAKISRFRCRLDNILTTLNKEH